MSDSSEESSEEFDKIKKDFEKLLSAQQKTELNSIVDNINSAQTLEQSVDGLVSKISKCDDQLICE